MTSLQRCKQTAVIWIKSVNKQLPFIENVFLFFLKYRLFESYPMSQQFFLDFNGTPIEAIKNDVQKTHILQQHGIRVMRVVEKVIGRIDDLEKVEISMTY